MTIRWIRPLGARPSLLLSRRQFLGVAGASLLSACKHPQAPAPDLAQPTLPTVPALTPLAPPAARTSLGADGWRLVAALTERILPSHDGPGAREAEVVRFIDRQLATPAVKPLAEAVGQFVASMVAWEQKHGTRFDALDGAEQDRVIAALAAAKLDLDFDSQAELFEFLHSFTLEGFLSDPKYGGNKDQVGWKYIAWSPMVSGHVHAGKGG